MWGKYNQVGSDILRLRMGVGAKVRLVDGSEYVVEKQYRNGFKLEGGGFAYERHVIAMLPGRPENSK